MRIGYVGGEEEEINKEGERSRLLQGDDGMTRPQMVVLAVGELIEIQASTPDLDRWEQVCSLWTRRLRGGEYDEVDPSREEVDIAPDTMRALLIAPSSLDRNGNKGYIPFDLHIRREERPWVTRRSPREATHEQVFHRITTPFSTIARASDILAHVVHLPEVESLCLLLELGRSPSDELQILRGVRC